VNDKRRDLSVWRRLVADRHLVFEFSRYFFFTIDLHNKLVYFGLNSRLELYVGETSNTFWFIRLPSAFRL
jgi:hypothetical protein